MGDKKILYIWDADYPWDIRVEKICSTLVDNSHEVHIVSRNLRKNQTYECVNGIHVHRLNAWKKDTLNYYLSFPLFFSPVWRNLIRKIIRENNIQLIIVRDLPMAIAGIWAGKEFNIPVFLDMAEDYMAMIKDIWKTRKFQGLNLVVRNPYLAKLVERYSFRKTDHILVVTDEAIDIVERGGGDRSKVTIVSNTPRLSSFEKNTRLINDDIEYLKDHYSVIYTGGVQMGRGLQTVLSSIEHIVLRIPEFLFVVVGDGYAAKQLKTMASDIGVEKYVKWIGWVYHDDMFSYIKSCKIGVIPHLVTDHINTTIPNKIFDYMGCGIPVIASDADPLKRIIDDEICGKTYKSGDAISLSQAIFDIYDSDIDYGMNGENAVLKKYNWSEDANRLLDTFSGISR